MERLLRYRTTDKTVPTTTSPRRRRGLDLELDVLNVSARDDSLFQIRRVQDAPQLHSISPLRNPNSRLRPGNFQIATLYSANRSMGMGMAFFAKSMSIATLK
jgi:hypothetical protein